MKSWDNSSDIAPLKQNLKSEKKKKALGRAVPTPRRRRRQKRRLKISELAFFESLSRLFQLAHFLKRKRILLELNF